MHSLETLNQSLDWIGQSPKDQSPVVALCRRPAPAKRESRSALQLDVNLGVIGDHWYQNRTQNGGRDAQLSLLNLRVYQSVCGFPGAAHPGDPIIADIDTSAENLPIASQLQIGQVRLEVSDLPNFGCDSWAKHYGNDALRFVAMPAHQPLQLRGVLCRILQGGEIRTGDRIVKLA